MDPHTMKPPTISPPTPEEHAKMFRETHKGKGLSDKQIEDMCSAILRSHAPLAETEQAGYYKFNLASAIFYINVMINIGNPNTPDRFFKSFVGHCGGIAIPGDSFFDPAILFTCDPYTFEDIFTKQTAIMVHSEALTAFIYFYDKDSNLLGFMWGGGSGDVIGIMGGTGKWKGGYLT